MLEDKKPIEINVKSQKSEFQDEDRIWHCSCCADTCMNQQEIMYHLKKAPQDVIHVPVQKFKMNPFVIECC